MVSFIAYVQSHLSLSLFHPPPPQHTLNKEDLVFTFTVILQYAPSNRAKVTFYQIHLSRPVVFLFISLVGGEIPMDVRLGSGQLVSEELMTLGESLSQTTDPSLKLFQCAVCNRFTTDNLDVLGMHMGAERSLPEEEWRAVVGDTHQCKLCHYTTQLKANFQLHCKTDKHVQKYQLVAHIKEGGKGNEWRLKCVAIGNPVHLKCNACDYYTNSLEKLRLHTVNSRHEASLKLYKVSGTSSRITHTHHLSLYLHGITIYTAFRSLNKKIKNRMHNKTMSVADIYFIF